MEITRISTLFSQNHKEKPNKGKDSPPLTHTGTHTHSHTHAHFFHQQPGTSQCQTTRFCQNSAHSSSTSIYGLDPAEAKEASSLITSLLQSLLPYTPVLVGMKSFFVSFKGIEFVFFASVCWLLSVSHSHSEAATHQHIPGIKNINIICLLDGKFCCHLLLCPKNREQKIRREEVRDGVLTVTIS